MRRIRRYFWPDYSEIVSFQQVRLTRWAAWAGVLLGVVGIVT